ncbi:MAG: aldolase [Sphaerochaetaceae bacterium]|nr:aldolase [Sphaerochaetaceae bacterium]
MIQLGEQLIELGKFLHKNQYAKGSAGNLSVRLDSESILATPTNSSLGSLQIDRLSKLNMNGELIDGDRPSKEVPFHLAVYENSDANAVIHLHSTFLTALSCLKDLDPENVLRPVTPYVVMKAGEIPLIPYYKPGSVMIAKDIAKVADDHRAFLLANHGVVVTGSSIEHALQIFEELEESAKLFFILKGMNIRYLDSKDISELKMKS